MANAEQALFEQNRNELVSSFHVSKNL